MTAPQLRSIRDVHEIRLDDEHVAARGHSARNHRPDVEISTGLLRIDVLALVSEGETARADSHTGQLGEAVDE